MRGGGGDLVPAVLLLLAGQVQMGRFGFASWTLHMASIFFFSILWEFLLKEWKGASKAARIGMGNLFNAV